MPKIIFSRIFSPRNRGMLLDVFNLIEDINRPAVRLTILLANAPLIFHVLYGAF